MQDENAIELEPPGSISAVPDAVDRRPRMEDPLPVRLVAIGDVHLPARTGSEAELDRFYAQMLEFVRADVPGEEGLVVTYQSDNFRLRFRLSEGLIVHADYRPTQIQVESLANAERKLIEREIEYTRQKSVSVGYESLLLQDPAGNWVELVQATLIM